MSNIHKVREDFDRIAGLSEEGAWDHNAHYHAFLLKQLPLRLGEALDVGCGTGSFARELARRSRRVLAIDLSPRMVEVARASSASYPNIEYAIADANSWEFPRERFDCVASIATAHHLPLRPMLARMRDALRLGGVLLTQDIFRAQNPVDYLVGALGFPASKALRLVNTGSLTNRKSPELRRVWEEHGKYDAYPTLAEVRRACAGAGLAGAEVRRHLLWRYSVTW